MILRPIDLHWIDRTPDNACDLCAHGRVEWQIRGDVLLAAEHERTVSAAALYLLRTLERSHTKNDPLCEHLFPCCGHAMYDLPDEPDVYIIGCAEGDDFEIVHNTTDNTTEIRSASGRTWRVECEEWRAAVRNFADTVAEFYRTCSPKTPSEDDAAGYARFLEEWSRRVGRTFHGFC